MREGEREGWKRWVKRGKKDGGRRRERGGKGKEEMKGRVIRRDKRDA